MLALWRWLSVPRPREDGSDGWQFYTYMSMDDFGVHKKYATLYTAALSVSGVIKVDLGWRDGKRTRFEYFPATGYDEWRAFFRAVDYALNVVKDRQKESKFRFGGYTEQFRVLVGLAVDRQRWEFKVKGPYINYATLAAIADRGVFAKWNPPPTEDGPDWKIEPVFYARLHRDDPYETDEFDENKG